MELLGHEDTLTGLSVSKNGHFLLSNAMDRTVRAWDLRFVCVHCEYQPSTLLFALCFFVNRS